jgi:ABC-type Zn uptake system ZnuABC Zn-binding protein ZnuA
LPAFAGGARAAGRDGASLPPGEKLVVASTSWVAARAGGAEHIRVLAPAELRHPPEYELKPSDLAAASRAGLVLYAEWDTFARRLKEAAGAAYAELINFPGRDGTLTIEDVFGYNARVLLRAGTGAD